MSAGGKRAGPDLTRAGGNTVFHVIASECGREPALAWRGGLPVQGAPRPPSTARGDAGTRRPANRSLRTDDDARLRGA